MNKRIPITLLTLLAVCVCLAALVAIPAFLLAVPQLNAPSSTAPTQAVFIPSQVEPTQAGPVPTGSAAVPTLTPAPSQNKTPTTATGAKSLPADTIRQMEEIQKQVVQFRGLALKNPLQRDLLTNEELLQRVKGDFFKDYTRQDAKNDVVGLALFGFLQPDFNLYDFYINLYSEQVAGYYDDETKDMFVVQGKGFQGVERMTYSHEFVHVLQDQTYDLRGRMHITDEYCKTHAEYCSAAKALIEGDATLSEQMWFTRYATAQDKKEVQDYYQDYKSPVYDSAPEYMKQDFLFAYTQGAEFVQTLYNEGGWEKVNEVFKFPPQSTEQILHPDHYPSDLPDTMAVHNLVPHLGDGWERLDNNSLGEWYTYLMLSAGWDENARLPEATAQKAAAGWKGDNYSVYWNENLQKSAMNYVSTWETGQDQDEFWSALLSYAQKRWGNPTTQTDQQWVWENTADGKVIIDQTSQDVAWMIVPTDTDLQKLTLIP